MTTRGYKTRRVMTRKPFVDAGGFRRISGTGVVTAEFTVDTGTNIMGEAILLRCVRVRINGVVLHMARDRLKELFKPAPAHEPQSAGAS